MYCLENFQTINIHTNKMSSDLENQIKESIANDKINFFFKKFKFRIISFFLIIFSFLIFYFAKIHYENNKYATELNQYSIAIESLKKNNNQNSISILKKLLSSNNEIIVSLAVNQLLNLNLNSKEEILLLIKIIEQNNALSKNNRSLLNIKKFLIMFDNEDINTMNSILDINKKNNPYAKIFTDLLNDYYLSKNLLDKSKNLKINSNDK